MPGSELEEIMNELKDVFEPSQEEGVGADVFDKYVLSDEEQEQEIVISEPEPEQVETPEPVIVAEPVVTVEEPKPFVFVKRDRKPSKYLALQKQHEEAKLREARMKNNLKGLSNTKTLYTGEEVVDEEETNDDAEKEEAPKMRRVKIGGKYKMIPIVDKATDQEEEQNAPTFKPVQRKAVETNQQRKKAFAKILKKEAIRQVEDSAQSIAEIQRIRCEKNLDCDSGNVSIRDLRKLSDIKRQKERAQEEAKKLDSRESIIDSIMNDPTLTQFAKEVKISRVSNPRNLIRYQKK